MDLLQLQYFRAIAQYENMTKAAQALFVSQPNLSTSLSRLEADLNVKLFERRRGKISLTPSGQEFLDCVSRALDELNVGIERLHSGENAARNSIKVAGAMIDIINIVLAKYYPDSGSIYIKQMNCANKDIYNRVQSEEVDFGFYFGQPHGQELEYNLIGECERVVMLRTDHPLAQAGYVSLSELAEEHWICNHCRDDAELFETFPKIGGFVPKVFFECDNVQMESTLVAARKGISICPATTFQKLVTDDPEAPLACLRISEQVAHAQIGVVRRRGHMLSEAALLFFDHLNQVFEGEVQKTERLFAELFPHSSRVCFPVK